MAYRPRGIVIYIMPSRLTKSHQQEVVADFIYETNLEMCMFVYLDEFLDYHRNLFPQDSTTYGTNGIKKLLEASYQAIREKINAEGLLTEKAAGEYMLRKK
jgi:hypothetical protein